MDGPSFKMFGFFSSKMDWGCYNGSIPESVSKKMGALICYKKFLSCEVDLFLCKSMTVSCMGHGYVWAGAPSCYWIYWISYVNRYARVSHRGGGGMGAPCNPITFF